MIKTNYNIILCGFMGCGKTTIGKVLSKITGLGFIDIDEYIENKTKMNIKQIFSVYGEDYFRAIEADVVKKISNSKGQIIACGGGTVLSNQNVENLKKNGKIIFLDVNKDILVNRLKNDKKRPLIKNKATIENLFNLRYEKYINCADFIIKANKNISDTCYKVAEIIYTLN